jgi:hypothetical protein
MKKTGKTLLALLMCLTFAQISQASKWRVNNGSVQAHFTQPQLAVNSSSVVNGDTIYMEGSSVVYNSFVVTKRLVIIGPGYYLGENDSTQANLNAASVSNINFTTGSKGSVMIGMTIPSYLTVQDTGILIKKCWWNQGTVQNCGNCVLIQNVFNMISMASASNIVISNNLSIGTSMYGPNLNCDATSSAMITNNIIRGGQYLYNCTLRNNIATGLTGGDIAATLFNCVSDHNIGASTQYGTSNNNQQNVDMSTVFVNTGSSDGKYRLKPGSPAIGAGAGGVDCGIFGGNYPYVLSGMPEVPAIWYLNVNGSNVTVKAKSH